MVLYDSKACYQFGVGNYHEVMMPMTMVLINDGNDYDDEDDDNDDDGARDDVNDNKND